ncbi:MAG: lysylphosphatidylglycerol synthase domain-containing protein [Elusimicrobiota bacterium]
MRAAVLLDPPVHGPARSDQPPAARRGLFGLGLRVLCALLGLIVIAGMIRALGWRSISSSISAIGWPWMIALVLLYAPAQGSFCLAWYWTLGPWRKRLGLRGIWRPFLAGDAVNCSIPSANAAGEPVKVALLRAVMPVPDAIASVTAFKYSDFLSLTLFLFAGLIVSWTTLSLPAQWYWGGAVILGGMIGASVLLLLLQRGGLYGRLASGAVRLLRLDGLVEAQAGAHDADRLLLRFYERRPKEFALSLVFNFLGWFGGVLEAYICLRLLGLPADWTTALAIETFALFLNNITFFVPGRIGVVEGGRAAIFAALGLPAAAGLAYGIVRRARELAWISLGYGILSGYRSVPPQGLVVLRPIEEGL